MNDACEAESFHPRPRPVPPRPDECCGSGCARCVYELYDEALAEWERSVALRNAQAGAPPP